MKIETKHDIGDVVWFIQNNRVFSSPVYQIDITASVLTGDWNKDKMIADYFVANGKLKLNEGKMFKTKKELLESL